MSLESEEKLRHSEGEMVIGLTTSDEGRPCIGMTFKGTEWILFTTKEAILAARLMRQLKTDMNIDSIAGPGFNWRRSLETKELQLLEGIDDKTQVVGIFVPRKNFDGLSSSTSNT